MNRKQIDSKPIEVISQKDFDALEKIKLNSSNSTCDKTALDFSLKVSEIIENGFSEAKLNDILEKAKTENERRKNFGSAFFGENDDFKIDGETGIERLDTFLSSNGAQIYFESKDGKKMQFYLNQESSTAKALRNDLIKESE